MGPPLEPNPAAGGPGAQPGSSAIYDIDPSVYQSQFNPDGSQDVPVEGLPAVPDKLQSAHGDNLAEILSEEALGRIVREMRDLFDQDKLSREDWQRAYMEGLDLLGVKQEKRSLPWPGACGVYHPLLSEAVVRFQSQAIMEIFPATGPTKSQVLGVLTPEKEQQARRVQEYMDYTLTEVMPEFRRETEKMLFALPLAGCAFKKTYNDPTLGRPASNFIPAEDFIMPYGASGLRTAPRYAEIAKTPVNVVKARQVSGFYAPVDLGEPVVTFDEVREKKDKLNKEVNINWKCDYYTLIESHNDIDIDELPDSDSPTVEPGEGGETAIRVPCPYVVTWEYNSMRVLSIRRNWNEGDPKREKILHYTQYEYVPGLGSYGYGLIHLIGSIARGSTSLLRQLVDAGTLSNLPGGLKDKNLRMLDSQNPIAPGEWRDVEGGMTELKNGFFALPYKEPSAVLFQLLQNLVEEGRRLGSTAEIDVGDISAQSPVGTTLAIMERSMKVMSAVQARLHASMREEFRILVRLIAANTPPEYPYDVPGGSRIIKRSDFDGNVNVLPVSDPNAATLSQRVVQYQAALQLSSQAPQIYDLPELHRQMMGILGVKDPEKIVPDKANIPRLEPADENSALVTGKPVRVFPDQNHQAHAAVHLNFVNDPEIQATLNQNPNGAALVQAIHAHITEHVAQQYRTQIEQKLGVALPQAGQPLPPDVENSVALMVADASDKLFNENKAIAAQQAAAQQAQDPVLQLQRQDLAVRAMAAQSKAQSDQQRNQIDLMKEQGRQETERLRIASQHQAAAHGTAVKAGAEAGNLRLEVERLRMDAERNHAEIAEILARINQMEHGHQFERVNGKTQ